jgi:hypothetical protein
MSLARTPLDITALSAAAQKALGPGPGKMMASRGMVPLPPKEQAQVLYQISLDADVALMAAARATAQGLPETMLATIAGDAGLDARVLDFFSDFVLERVNAFDALVLNPTTADQTVVILAKRGAAREIDLIAQNEQRLLRCPDIIGAMYLNPKARMSTVDRAVELAVRNQVKVNAVAGWEDIARVITHAGHAGHAGPAGSTTVAIAESDALFASVAAVCTTPDGESPGGEIVEVLEDDATVDDGGIAVVDGKKVPIDRLSLPQKIRLASMGNAFARNILVRDPLKIVAVAAIKNAGVTDFEAGKYARNTTLCDDVIRYIASKREWTAKQEVVKALCFNPKCPVPDAGRLIPFLRDRDLKDLAKSKGIAGVLVAQAKNLIARRGGKG